MDGTHQAEVVQLDPNVVGENLTVRFRRRCRRLRDLQDDEGHVHFVIVSPLSHAYIHHMQLICTLNCFDNVNESQMN